MSEHKCKEWVDSEFGSMNFIGVLANFMSALYLIYYHSAENAMFQKLDVEQGELECLKLDQSSLGWTFIFTRKKTRNFSVELDKEKFDKLEEKLSEKGITKKKWLNDKVDEEIGN